MIHPAIARQGSMMKVERQQELQQVPRKALTMNLMPELEEFEVPGCQLLLIEPTNPFR
jgi:hypothetical protein